MLDIENADQYPLCLATEAIIANKFEEQNLNNILDCNTKVELKLRIGVTPTIEEEMHCTLPYDLPGEEWKPIPDYPKYLISNKRRIKNDHGEYLKIDKYSQSILDLNGKSKRVNTNILVVELFTNYSDNSATLLYKSKLNIIKDIELKLRLNEKLSSIDILNYTVVKDLPGEVWKDIKDYEGLYKVSNMGRIFSITEKIIYHPEIIHNRYARVNLLKNKKWSHHLVHRLVAEAFIPKTEEDIRLGRDQVNHKDGNKMDNRVENLEWCNNSENQIHAYATGLQKTKLSDNDVIEICNKYKAGKTPKQLACEYGVDVTSIEAVLSGKSHKHIKRTVTRFMEKQYSLNEILLVKYLASIGMTNHEIKLKTKFSYNFVYNTTSGKSHADIHLRDYPKEVIDIQNNIQKE